MTRKFKSTITSWYAVEADDPVHVNLYNGAGDHRGYMVKSMVENSDDWREVTSKPILVTEDGYEVYSYHNTLKEVTEDFEILPIDPDDTSQNPVFHEMANAKAYVEKHKPRYSNYDLQWLAEQIEMYVDRASDKMEMKAQAKCFIYDLEGSKKH